MRAIVASRASDSPGIQALGKTSITLGVIDSFFGVLAVSGAVDEVDERFGQLMAVLVILLLLTTALPPVLRRLQRSSMTVAPRVGGVPTAAEVAPPSHRDAAPPPLAAEVLAAADRIEALNADAGNRAPEVRRECERLRELARSHSR